MIPFLEKTTKVKNKLIMRAAELGLTYVHEDHDLLKNTVVEELTYDEISTSQILRFDHIVRKIIKICGKDSTENYNEETIDKIWFYTLDSILRIKQQQMKVLVQIQGLEKE